MRMIVALFLFFSLHSHAGTYPISPRPLRLLIMESKHIVYGHVIKVEEITKKISRKNTQTDTYAVIAIRERLQGDIKEDTIRVSFYPNMICPNPEMYFENTDVIAFLNGENNNYQTHARSYGSKTLFVPEDYPIYKQRIAEMQLILKNSDKVVQLKDTIDWFVKCCENRVSCWDGTYELSPTSDFMADHSGEEFANYKILLSAEQKERLKMALICSAEDSYLHFGLVDLVYTGNEYEVDALMLHHLKVIIDDTDYWTVLDYMKRLLHLNKSESANSCIAEMVKSLDGYMNGNANTEKMKSIKQRFVALIENGKQN